MTDVVATPNRAGLLGAGDKRKIDAALELVAVPASAGASGKAGQVAVDASFVYFCIASGNWRRSALTTW